MIKLGVIFGGMSTENEVSVKSATSVINNLDKEKYEIFQIYIDKQGKWFEYNTNTPIENIIEYLKNMDVVFPVLHGLYGEDGTIQGMLELIKVPYVGCGIIASSTGMDKTYTKIIFEKANINQAKHIYIKDYNGEKATLVEADLEERKISLDEIIKLTNEKLKFPLFIKPSRSGSSVGVNKAENNKELKEDIIEAFKFDSKVLIEQGIKGKEVECAVLGNSKIGVEVSRVGEILSAEDFYTFDAKYENKDSKTTSFFFFLLYSSFILLSLFIKFILLFLLFAAFLCSLNVLNFLILILFILLFSSFFISKLSSLSSFILKLISSLLSLVPCSKISLSFILNLL